MLAGRSGSGADISAEFELVAVGRRPSAADTADRIPIGEGHVLALHAVQRFAGVDGLAFDGDFVAVADVLAAVNGFEAMRVHALPGRGAAPAMADEARPGLQRGLVQ